MSRKLPTVLTKDEVFKIIKHTYKARHKLAFKLGFLCGLRVSEIVNLRPEDVDYNRRLLFIRQGKGNKDRYVPFPAKFSKNLKNLPVGCGIRSLQRAFKSAATRAKIQKDVHFHTLRHSAATHYLENGMNIVQVQQLLGHSRIDTTTIYLHVSPSHVKKSMDNIWDA